MKTPVILAFILLSAFRLPSIGQTKPSSPPDQNTKPVTLDELKQRASILGIKPSMPYADAMKRVEQAGFKVVRSDTNNTVARQVRELLRIQTGSPAKTDKDTDHYIASLNAVLKKPGGEAQQLDLTFLEDLDTPGSPPVVSTAGIHFFYGNVDHAAVTEQFRAAALEKFGAPPTDQLKAGTWSYGFDAQHKAVNGVWVRVEFGEINLITMGDETIAERYNRTSKARIEEADRSTKKVPEKPKF